MEKKKLLKFLEIPKTIKEIEKEFDKQEEIYKSLDKLYEKEKIRYYESNGIYYYEKTNHEFSLTLVRIIAQSAAYICSNPKCRILTIAGLEISMEKVIKIGEAAHIIGNKEGSARYKEKTKLDKNSVENGIWLCRNCHKMIDSNGGRGYPIELLMQWKKEHIKYLTKNLGKPVNLSSDNLRTAQPFTSWSENPDIKYPQIFIRDPDRGLIMQEIKEKFNVKTQNNQIIRVSGLSGLGKTRLIYETIKSSKYKENTYYYENASWFFNSEIYVMLKNNIQMQLILVIDNCTIDDHQKIRENFSVKTDKIIIITIGFHNKKHGKDDNYFQIEFMDPDLIKQILKKNFEKIPNKIMEKIMDASHCFPKFALKFMSNYLQGNKWYVTNYYDINRLIFGETRILNKGLIKTILTHIALFSPLGYSGKIKDEYFKTSEFIGFPLGNLNDESYNQFLKLESEWICQLVELNWTDYNRVVDDYINKGIIEGEFRIKIRPVPLSIFLINEWWSQNSDAIKIIATIPEELVFYLTHQFFTLMDVYCVLEKGSRSYHNIIEFLKNLEEKDLYLEKVLKFILYRYKDLKPFDREMLLQNLMNKEDIIIKFLNSILTGYLSSLKLRDIIEWIKKIINKVSIEKISQTLNEWSVYIAKSQSKLILIEEFQKLIKDINWSNSILQTLFIYFDFLSDQLKNKFVNCLAKKDSQFILFLIAISVNKPSEESMILICKSLINSIDNNTTLLSLLSFIHNDSYFNLRKYLLIELSKNERCVNFLFMFILRNQDILDEKILQEFVKNTNKFITTEGKAFQNLLYDILYQKKFDKIIPLVKTYEVSEEIIQANNSFNQLYKNTLQMTFLNSQYNLPNFKVLSESFKPREIQYLIISLDISKQIEKKFYNFYNIFLEYDFFYYINSIIFPSTKYYNTPEQRDFILKDFARKGFYLVDFNQFLTSLNLKQEDILIIYENSFKFKLESLISKKVPIIILGEILYQGLHKDLKKDGFNIIHEQPIPKPNERNYNSFKILFKNALITAGYRPK